MREFRKKKARHLLLARTVHAYSWQSRPNQCRTRAGGRRKGAYNHTSRSVTVRTIATGPRQQQRTRSPLIRGRHGRPASRFPLSLSSSLNVNISTTIGNERKKTLDHAYPVNFRIWNQTMRHENRRDPSRGLVWRVAGKTERRNKVPRLLGKRSRRKQKFTSGRVSGHTMLTT